MQREPLRVLLLEDDPADADLLELELQKDPDTSFDVTHVEDEAGFRAALVHAWDVIVSDYRIPGFSAPAALRLVTTSDLDTPFVVVSGAIGDAAAAEVMRLGAADFVAKDRLGTLSLSLSRCVAGIRERRRQACYLNAAHQTELRNVRLDHHLQLLRERRHDAVRLNDGVLQDLVLAEAALEPPDVTRATEAVRRAFTQVQDVSSRLLPTDLVASDLRRDAPEGARAP